jgi:hypothetical protein
MRQVKIKAHQPPPVTPYDGVWVEWRVGVFNAVLFGLLVFQA